MNILYSLILGNKHEDFLAGSSGELPRVILIGLLDRKIRRKRSPGHRLATSCYQISSLEEHSER